MAILLKQVETKHANTVKRREAPTTPGADAHRTPKKQFVPKKHAPKEHAPKEANIVLEEQPTPPAEATRKHVKAAVKKQVKAVPKKQRGAKLKADSRADLIKMLQD